MEAPGLTRRDLGLLLFRAPESGRSRNDLGGNEPCAVGGSRAGLCVWRCSATATVSQAGRGMGRLGGLSLLDSAVPPWNPAEANAALSVGGYVPAGMLPVAAGRLSDVVGLTAGAPVFPPVLMGLAVLGGLVAVAGRRRVPEPA